MYLDNKYTRWYNKIVENANLRTIQNGYTENHHIIPRSFGGNDEPTNLVKLTAKEHFICHLLLTKMTTGNDRYKMIYALHMLSNVQNIGEGRYKPSSRLYEYARKLFIDSMDSIWTPEKRAKQSKTISNIMKTTLTQLTPEEMSARMKNSCSSAESWTDSRRKKISTALTGKVLSEATKIKMSKPCVFISPNGEEFRYDGLGIGCAALSLNYGSVKNCLMTSGTYKKWIIRYT
jgi:hypothetical protein